jgi:phosphate-selective porin OprO and OprP
MRFCRAGFAGFVAVALAIGAAVAQTESAQPDNAALLKRLDEQDRRIKELERRLESQTGFSQPAVTSSRPSSAAPAGSAELPATPPAERSRATSASSFTGAAPGVPVIATAGPTGYSLQTADRSSSIRFHANLAVDGRYYSSGAPSTADTWLLRQVRPYIDGTIDKIFDYRLVPDFANGKTIILDAYADARFKPWFVVQAGKFKGPIGLERLQFSPYNRFIELGLTSDLVPNRDLGLQVAGDVAAGLFSYAFGGFDGVTDGTSTDASPSADVNNDYGHLDWEGRVFARPFAHSGNFFFKGLGIGIAATRADTTGTPGSPAAGSVAAVTSNALLPSYRTPGQQVFFSFRGGATPSFADGERIRWSPQFYYYTGSFGLVGEYVEFKQDIGRQVSATVSRSATLSNKAWQLTAAYFLTGEEENYYGFTPKSPFQVGGPGWGAFELALRVHELTIDDAAFAGGAASFADPSAAARQARAIGGGVNWWLNQNLRWMLDYEVTRFDGGAAHGANRSDERALLTRFFLAF